MYEQEEEQRIVKNTKQSIQVKVTNTAMNSSSKHHTNFGEDMM